ncbi:MAG: acyl-CoA dehydrogenase family protein [Deltaproteobacteria bacterium]|nr:acyl-CoA dehydrogenase family protein [Deltaproteobacteria bacterium]MBW1922015.1 acyl-CoA dehydrogenase family protein [Deltaproteobacteria bacterium]MBW1949193.1 acyl-CoA dehydrogenase family protein [Deltaproteobacteria bacterium]MBW2008180.1 acyl-CoA dehydrogenase family protein [Deltaproteobacteria bacterium]MBW2103175.1 acyl-CoA dehydrogenase family protein [Deltaproteobacteria bacterium]
MDFSFTAEQERFRREVREYLEREVPPRWKELGYLIWEETDESWDITRQWNRKLGEKGWLALTWPRVYGGQERSHIDQLILDEEMARAGTPTGIETAITIGWVCPTIMLFGTEEQKLRYLPDAAKGRIIFCLGYSEPNAGSDLAAVRTTAVEDGDHYVINGQKVWTTVAHRADYCWLAARTDPDAPKHKGVSMFVVDMKSPGITVKPLINILGFHSFNEVFFDEVRVPKENLVGQKNMGWYQLAVALDFERSGVGTPARMHRTIDRLVAYCRQTRRNGRLLSEDPVIRKKLARLSVEAEVLRLLCYRITWIQEKGKTPNYEASLTKVFASELLDRLANTGMEILGPYGMLDRGSPRAALRGEILRLYLTSPSMGIGGGTSEIQRNIIAMRGLGLPRK